MYWTKKKAKLCSYEKWVWLEKNPMANMEDFPGWKKNNGEWSMIECYHGCACCKYNKQRKAGSFHSSPCYFCPVPGLHCLKTRSLFRQYEYNVRHNDVIRAKRFAIKIKNVIFDSLTKEEKCLALTKQY